MSWQDHISSLLASGFVHSAVFIDRETCAIMAWDGPLAHNPGANIQQEMVDLVKAIDNPTIAQSKGITVGCTKYFCLNAVPGLIYGKLGAGGLCAAGTNKVIILGMYGEGVPPPMHNRTIKMFCENLNNHGY